MAFSPSSTGSPVGVKVCFGAGVLAQPASNTSEAKLDNTPLRVISGSYALAVRSVLEPLFLDLVRIFVNDLGRAHIHQLESVKNVVAHPFGGARGLALQFAGE